MKPVNAEDNPGLAKLPTEVRNKMGYMKKGGMTKHPMKKGSKRMKKFEDGGYTGDDEIVKYRMGQIKDPGIDLFKLTSGEAQEAKPVPLAKKAEPAKPAETKPATPAEVKTTSEDIFDETGAKSKFKRNQETGELYTLEDTPKPVKPVAKKAASSSSANTSSAKTFVETKTKKPYEPYEGNFRPYEPYEGNFKPSSSKAKTLQEKRDARETKRNSVVSKMASGGKVSSASKRADGCAVRGKTRA
jgi:hypothetical protein